jgi:hypothetical protein
MLIKNLIIRICIVKIIFIFFIFQYSCSQKNEIEINLNNSLYKDSIKSENQVTIDSTIGVLIYEFNNNDSIINFYDDDKKLWYSFRINDYDNDKIRPFAMKIDNFLLIFRCIKKEKCWYKIIVNEEKRIAKYVRDNDSCFEFQDWEKHIKDVIISFDSRTNPLREYPSSNSKEIKLDTGEFMIFRGDSINGEWLRIYDIHNDGNNIGGWIKWRDKTKLLIELFYFM